MVPVSNPAKRRNQMRPRLRFASGSDCHTCFKSWIEPRTSHFHNERMDPYASCLP